MGIQREEYSRGPSPRIKARTRRRSLERCACAIIPRLRLSTHALHRSPAVFGLLAAALALSWQALTVRYNFEGNWTGLFYTGGNLSVPPELNRERIYTLAGKIGYDGQYYHYIAHDPFRLKGFEKYMDAPRLRYRRILVPLTAHLLAAGQDRFVDVAFVGVILLSVFLGTYWLGGYASDCGWHPAWGLGFLLTPAAIISIDRLVVDIALASLTIGFALYARRGPPWKLYLVLVCALLARETGALLLGGYCVYLLWQRLPRKAFLFGTAAVPALVWFWYLQTRTRGDLIRLFMHSAAGFLPFGHRMSPQLRIGLPVYDLPRFLAGALTALDYLALLGMALAVVLAVRFVLERSRGPQEFAGLLYAFMVVSLAFVFSQGDVYTFPRVASPLLVLVALHGLAPGARAGLLPLVLVVPRLAAQLSPQLLGVLRGIFSAGGG